MARLAGTKCREKRSNAIVFARFYRVIGGHEAGSGIGLAIVREIAVRHGATVSVTMPPGGIGSLFRVTIARAASASNSNDSTPRKGRG